MASQSGIRATPELVQAFAAATPDGSGVRALRAGIADEAVVLVDTLAPRGTFEEDLALIEPWLSPTQPAFILLHCDAPKWVMLLYVPDHARVRDKMLFASSKTALVKELGASNFVDDIYATTKEEASLEGYRKHREHATSAAPLTDREREIAQVRATETTADIGIATRRANAPGVSFPLSADAEAALASLASGEANFVALRIDADTETMHADASGSFAWDAVATAIAHDAPRFVFYKPEGAAETVFAYVSPPAARVKERMWYSASRAFALAEAERITGAAIKKRFEIDSMAEFDRELVADLPAHNSPTLGSKVAFAKPARPGRR
ncbi:Twinfilin-1 [Polyrhizophydium stewartii]|uniref:Twinfilin-1 n=1 Tax=Polyrhizophydium stewartii TaxID=2732419 RepID=A0ABR4N798_9FUNG